MECRTRLCSSGALPSSEVSCIAVGGSLKGSPTDSGGGGNDDVSGIVACICAGQSTSAYVVGEEILCSLSVRLCPIG